MKNHYIAVFVIIHLLCGMHEGEAVNYFSFSFFFSLFKRRGTHTQTHNQTDTHKICLKTQVLTHY